MSNSIGLVPFTAFQESEENAMLKEKLMDATPTSVALSATASMASNLREEAIVNLGMEGEEEKMVREKEEEEKRKQMQKYYAIGALVTVLLSGTAILVEASAICVIAFTIPIFVAPVTVIQRKKLMESEGIRDLLNMLKYQGDRLKGERTKLTQEVDNLDKQVKELRKIENELGVITEKQGSNVSSFIEALKENKKVLAAMEEHIRSEVLEDVIGLVLKSDSDGDFRIEEDEIELLLLRIQSRPNLTVDKEKLRSTLMAHAGGRVGSFVNLAKELMLAKDTSQYGITASSRSLSS